MELPDESPKLQKFVLFNLFVGDSQVETLKYLLDDLKKLKPHLQDYDLIDEKKNDIIKEMKDRGISCTNYWISHYMNVTTISIF